MSTANHIGIIYNDGSVKTILCPFNGELYLNGVVLCHNYSDYSKIELLVNSVSLTFLGPKLAKVIREYNDSKPATYPSLRAYKKWVITNEHIKNIYLFSQSKNEWFYIDNSMRLQKMTALKEILQKNQLLEITNMYIVMFVTNNENIDNNELVSDKIFKTLTDAQDWVSWNHRPISDQWMNIDPKKSTAFNKNTISILMNDEGKSRSTWYEIVKLEVSEDVKPQDEW